MPKSKGSGTIGGRQYCTFRLDTLSFGLPVEQVQEVLRFQEMTRVPLAPPTIGGLINLRGQIITAIDLRPCLGLPARSTASRPMNVVVRRDEGVVSLLVDEIGDVLEPEERTFEELPETAGVALRNIAHGVCKLEHGLLLLLDIGKSLDLAASAAEWSFSR